MSTDHTTESQYRHRSGRGLAAIYVRGIAMGAADVVPGVSGGTIAFITGIYEELLDSIRRINPKALSVLSQQGPAACWQFINGNFLLALVLGILTSIVSLAALISRLLVDHELLVWSFFFGLIAASSWFMVKQLRRFDWRVLIAFGCGIGVALLVAELKPAQLEADPIKVFLSGSIAICAMILPGISGSFILVLLGMYAPVLTAIKDFQWVLLSSFAAGCGIGLLSFSHLLSWLFKRFHDVTMAVLTGFLLGSLNLVWPWKQTLSYYQNSSGEMIALEQQNLLPANYEIMVGPADTIWAISLMFVGLSMVLGLEKMGTKIASGLKK